MYNINIQKEKETERERDRQTGREKDSGTLVSNQDRHE